MPLTRMTPTGPVNMSPGEAAAFLADQQSLTAASQSAGLKQAALAALEASDRVAVRCLKAGTEYPPAWQVYDAVLREAARTGAGPLPERPDYPAGPQGVA